MRGLASKPNWTRTWISALIAALGLTGAAALGAQPVGDRPAISFQESSEDWGLVFDHHNGATGEYFMMEANAGGVIILDYDGDGDNDALMVDAGVLPGHEGEPARTVLFRNEGAGRFVDVTDSSGIVPSTNGTGGTAGDIDGDGDIDLYLTGFEDARLLENRGDGTFDDVTVARGATERGWSTSAAFADLDRDGDLDLYIVRYVHYSTSDPTRCRSRTGELAYCHPEVFEPMLDRLLINEGGHFTDGTSQLGGVPAGHGLGVVIVDVDNDGWLDVYVANDKTPNHLLKNKADGSFEDTSLLSGTAYGDRFTAEAGMGVDASDVDLDGDLDIVVTNYALETNALYLNFGNGMFSHGRNLAGLAEPSIDMLGFGVDFADFDQDGDEDLIVANGHVLDNIEKERPSLSYRQPNQVFENRAGRLIELDDAGLDVMRVSRALASGDLDGDGDIDVIVVNTGDRAEVYENVTTESGSWIGVDLASDRGNTSGIGARLRLSTETHELTAQAITASSFQSQNSLTRHFGLGSNPRAEALTVTWPTGRRQRLRLLPGNRRLRVVEPPL